jgi:hypothetical protein
MCPLRYHNRRFSRSSMVFKIIRVDGFPLVYFSKILSRVHVRVFSVIIAKQNNKEKFILLQIFVYFFIYSTKCFRTGNFSKMEI